VKPLTASPVKPNAIADPAVALGLKMRAQKPSKLNGEPSDLDNDDDAEVQA